MTYGHTRFLVLSKELDQCIMSPSCVSGKGGVTLQVSCLMSAVQGIVDLVWMPVQQYQDDGRIVMGLRRGATSFTTSSGVAVVELTSRALQSLQVCCVTSGKWGWGVVQWWWKQRKVVTWCQCDKVLILDLVSM